MAGGVGERVICVAANIYDGIYPFRLPHSFFFLLYYSYSTMPQLSDASLRLVIHNIINSVVVTVQMPNEWSALNEINTESVGIKDQ